MDGFRWQAAVLLATGGLALADELPLPHPPASLSPFSQAATPAFAAALAPALSAPGATSWPGAGHPELFGWPLVREPALRLTNAARELTEGIPATIGWAAGGVVYSVALTASYEPIGAGGPGRRRSLSLVQPSTEPLQQFTWDVPWLDTTAVTLRLKGFGRDARLMALEEWTAPYRPARLADKHDDGIYVDLRGPHGQRLYLLRDDRITLAARCSGAAGARTATAGYHPRAPHDHLGLFRVTSRALSHRSSLNEDWLMRYVLRYHNGHAIHATTRGYYRLLGRPASHGCVRLHLNDARQLYTLCGIGTRVEIF